MKPGQPIASGQPATSSSATRRVAVIVLLSLLVIGAGIAALRYGRRDEKVAVPAISTAGLEKEVVVAINEARVEVEHSPRSAESWGKMGMVLFAHEMFAESQQFFEQAERLDPNDSRWPYYRALVLWREKPEEGVALLQRAAEISPRDSVIKLRLAEWLFELDRVNEAEARFDEVLARQQDNPRALLGRGQIRGRRGEWDAALAPLKQAAEQGESRKAAHSALAEAYLRLGNEKAADAEKAIASDLPKDPPWSDPFIRDAARFQRGLKPRLTRANQLIIYQQFGPAATLLKELVNDYPDSDEANLALGKALIRLNEPVQAEPYLRRAVELNSKSEDGQFLLGGLLIGLHQDYPAAEECYRKVIELKPNHGVAHFQLGSVLLKRGDKKGALAAWRNAAKHRPDLAQIHLALGELLLQENQIDESIQHLEIAANLKDDKARELLEKARAKKKM